MSDQFANKELKDTINLYFDKALNKEEEIELMKQVNTNPDIEALLHKEEAFRNKLKFALGKTPASSGLVASIKDQIDHC